MAECPNHSGQEEIEGGALVSEPGTGRMMPLPGYGALKGRLDLDPRIDLTKPIYAQAVSLERAGRGRKAPAGKS